MRSVARTLILIASTLLAVVLLLTAPASAGVCSTAFGSLPKDDPAMGTGEVDTVRAGRHECFDRLVVHIDGHRPATTSATGPGHHRPQGHTVRGGCRRKYELCGSAAHHCAR